jgi:hypothetical protein
VSPGRDIVGSGANFAGDMRSKGAGAQVYFSPVYFGKRSGPTFPRRGRQQQGGVAVAEVGLAAVGCDRAIGVGGTGCARR